MGEDNLVLTSAGNGRPCSRLWSFGDFFVEKKQFELESHVEFSNLVQDKVIGAQPGSIVTVYDLNTGQLSRTLKPTRSNGYEYRAAFDPSDSMILSDGFLWDYRAASEIHNFASEFMNIAGRDRTYSEMFLPSGLQIRRNTEVWDIRTFRLLRTVPELDQCQIVFNTGGDVIFVLPSSSREEAEDPSTGFKTLEASDFSLIKNVNTKKFVDGLCPSRDDSSLAVVELDGGLSAVTLYDVGRSKSEEEVVENIGTKGWY